MEYYENKLQETANKYVDDRYVVSVRNVNENDLNNFVYDSEFWLNNVNQKSIKTSQNEWEYKFENHKIYVIPYLRTTVSTSTNYNLGDEFKYYNKGIADWIIVKIEPTSLETENYLYLIPKEPMELVIENSRTNLRDKAFEVIENYSGGSSYGMYTYININNYDLQDYLQDFLGKQTETIYIYNGPCVYYKDNYIEVGCGGILESNDGIIDYKNGKIWQDLSSDETQGFRPVVSLKVRNKSKEKELTDKIKIGDNIKYSANGYTNWKALSIDEDNNTIDIISGGIVKNITLTGKDDYDNLEDIFQKEADNYKNGNKVVKAGLVEFDDANYLNQINDKVKSEYWTNNSRKSVKDANLIFNGSKMLLIYSYIGTMKYDEENNEIKKDWIATNLSFSGSPEAIQNYRGAGFDQGSNKYIYEGDQSYTAGLRPIITLKRDSVEKLSESETKKVEDSSQKLDKVIYKEQISKNKDYKVPSSVDDTTSSGTKIDKDHSTSSESTIIERTTYKNSSSVKYNIIVLYIIDLVQFIIIIYLIIRRKNNI